MTLMRGARGAFDRTARPVAWISVVALVAGLGLLSGCGSDDPGVTATKREAASGSPTSCSGSNARTGRVSLENRLNLGIRFKFDQIDCADWSGPTPAASSPFTLGSPTRAGPAFRGSFEVTLKTSFSGATCNSPWRTRILTADGKVLAAFRTRLFCGGGGSNNPPVYLQIYSGGNWSYRNTIPLPPDLIGGTYAYVGLSNNLNLFVKPGGGPAAVRG